jgi:hypothetical protein
MDVCTLIVVTATTLQLCYAQPQCHPSADNTKQLCSTFPTSCGVSWPTYECKRPDGSAYIFVDEGGAQGGLGIIQNDSGTVTK